MKIAISSIGSRGDVQPLVSLGAALISVGHQVILAAPGEQAHLAEQAGVTFQPLGSGFFQLARNELVPRNIAGGLVAAWHTFNATLRSIVEETAEDTLAAAQDADLLIAAGQQFLGASVAERLDIPYLYAALTPMSARSDRYPPLPLAGLQPPRWLNRLGWIGTEHMATAALRPGLNAARTKLGLAPLTGGVLAHVVNAQPALLAFSLHLVPAAPDRPPRHQQVGPWLGASPPDWQPPVELLRFLDAGEPPLYLGFGTMEHRDPLRLLLMVLEAGRAAAVRLVLGGRWAGLGGEGARPDAQAFICGDVPHAWLFPRVRAAIHHGGAGTTHAGLAAGLPSFLVPHLGDQLFWGRRVASLGLGPQPVRFRNLTSNRLAAALQSLATDRAQAARAAAFGTHIAHETGLPSAVRAIESLAP